MRSSSQEVQDRATIAGQEAQLRLFRKEQTELLDKLTTALRGTEALRKQATAEAAKVQELRFQLADAEDERQQDFLLQVELSRLLADERKAHEETVIRSINAIGDLSKEFAAKINDSNKKLKGSLLMGSLMFERLMKED